MNVWDLKVCPYREIFPTVSPIEGPTEVVQKLHIKWICTVEPPNNGHVGTWNFVLYKEVVLSSEVTNVLV